MSDRTTATATVDPASPSIIDEPPVGPVVADRYELRERLGSGGSAVVYRAHDRLLAHDVALKILHADRIGPAGLARLRREAAIARSVTSPHLVRVFDIGTEEPLHFLSMEHVAGGTLRDRLQPGGLPLATVLAWGEQLLAGLAALHARSVAHRDVKPGNLLLTEDGTLKLADLGLARRLGSDETRATIGDRLIGTWDYIAPEQVAGQDGDARSDLYATGVVLFETLTGAPPFGKERSLGALLGRLRGRAPRVRRLRRHCPRWLDRFIARLLDPLPERRFADARPALDAWRRRRTGDGFSGRRALAVLAVLAAAGVLADRAPWPFSLNLGQGPRFQRLAADGSSGIVALGSDGSALWRLTDIDPDYTWRIVPMHLRRGARPVLAGVLRRPADNAPERTRILSVLDPESGRTLRTIELASGASFFPEYPDRYHPEMLLARDLDGDGVDELFVTYYLEAHAPSYTVLYEPALERSRVLFAGSGYHRIEEVADVDGDGRAEAIFGGINNRMGWQIVAATVRIDPWIGEGKGQPEDRVTALSPDRAPVYRLPLSYTLVPRGYTASEPGRALTLDVERRRLFVHYLGGQRPTEVGFDGFIVGRYERPLAARREARTRAYAHLREALRTLDGGDGAQAIAETGAARAAASEAEEPLLERAIARFEAQALVAAGRLAEADDAFARIAVGDDGIDVSFDAAKALHLRGELASAMRWYERGLGPGGRRDGGKPRLAFLAGIVFIHLERGELAAAAEAIHRYAAQFPENTPQTDVLREVVRWLAGDTPVVAHLRIPHNATDPLRYFGLELRNARSEDPEALLAEVRAQLPESYDSVGGLHSLAGVLFERLGRRDEAAAAHARALDWLATWVHRDPNLRIVHALARSRAGGIALVPSASLSERVE